MSDFLQYTFLYEFTLGTKVWRYTSNVIDVVDPLGNAWESAAISDDGIATSGESAADALNITASVDLVPSRIWMFSPPRNVMEIRILSAVLPDKPVAVNDAGIDNSMPDATVAVSNIRVQYVGEIAQCSFGAPGVCSFVCETIGATMQREGLRLVWQRSCPKVIYNCGVDKSLHAWACVIQSIAGDTIVVDPPGTGDFAAGLLEYTHPVKGEESVTIESGGGSSLVIFDGAADLYVGQQVTIYRGCNQTPTSCISFANYLNYGGIKDLPGSSPFDGTSSPSF